MRGRGRESKRACVGGWYHVWGESAYTFARVIIMGERTASTSVVVVVRAVAGFVVKTIKTRRCGRLYKSKVCVPPALTKAPPLVPHDGMQAENPATPLKVAAPTDTRPAASQPGPTQLPVGVATAQPMVAHATVSMAAHELPGVAGS